ncbi:hypothetical protein AB0P37_11695 [Streptomyces antimycoticus]|uniref:hypothetical protein n=1 Tax=Streptomyces antimycoticus TaxID=68175 RepID=UPI003427148A
MNTRIARVIIRPTGGLTETVDDIEREDGDGHEAEPEARLGLFLTRLVRESDARIANSLPRHAVGVASGRLVVGADQRCVCRRPADQCRCPDPRPAGRGTATAGTRHPVAGLLTAVAEHLAVHRPEQPMTEAARMTCALGTARTATAARPLLRVLPFPAGAVTRGAYAARLQEIAEGTR